MLLNSAPLDGDPPNEFRVTMRFCQPPPHLTRYFASFYHLDVSVPEGELVSDYLHPEWGNLRFHKGPLVSLGNRPDNRVGGTTFSATGPSAHATHFTVRASRIWGIALLPAAWAKFMRVPADTLADTVNDGWTHPAFAQFRPLARTLFTANDDVDAELNRIIDFFTPLIERPLPAEDRILALHAAIIDKNVHTVADLAERVGCSASTVERICRASFGFAPKLLLRRQRFARSLATYMVDPERTWVDSLDEGYYDQAQFVKDFKAFMGMSPRAYGAMKHPFLDASVAERQRLAKAPLQALAPPSSWGVPTSA